MGVVVENDVGVNGVPLDLQMHDCYPTVRIVHAVVYDKKHQPFSCMTEKDQRGIVTERRASLAVLIHVRLPVGMDLPRSFTAKVGGFDGTQYVCIEITGAGSRLLGYTDPCCLGYRGDSNQNDEKQSKKTQHGALFYRIPLIS